MFTLSIEHPITDFATWKSAFDRFADARTQGGVVGERIGRAIEDPHHLIVDLDFETREHAEAFRQFLTSVVWSNPAASPGLAGHPATRILERMSLVG